MRVLVLAIIPILLWPATSSAQTFTPEAQAQMHRGSVKIWLGVALIGAGAFVIPVSATASSHTGIPPAAASVGAGLIGAGTYMVWRGAREQRKAVGLTADTRAFRFGRSGERSSSLARQQPELYPLPPRLRCCIAEGFPPSARLAPYVRMESDGGCGAPRN